MRFSASLDSELCAGEMLRLAGFSSGTGVGARGAYSSIAASYVRISPTMRFYGECFMFVSRLLFAAQYQTGTACGRFHFYSVWVRIAIRAFSNVARLLNLLSSLQTCTFLYAIPTGNGVGGAAKYFLQKHIILDILSTGRMLGLKCGSRTAAAPDCAKESSTLWTLFI